MKPRPSCALLVSPGDDAQATLQVARPSSDAWVACQTHRIRGSNKECRGRPWMGAHGCVHLKMHVD